MASLTQLVCLLLNLLTPTDYCSQELNPETEGIRNHNKTLFVFGDSLFDPGNNQYLNATQDVEVEGTEATFWPYGQTYFHRPTGRLSDGRLVPDFVAQFAGLPIPPPYLQPGSHRFSDGVNFASAGAGVLIQTHPGTINFPTQLSYFKAMEESLRQSLGDEETKKVISRAVYLLSIGGNDYFIFPSIYPNATHSFMRQYVGMVIGNLTSVLHEIYRIGGRKIAFQNAGPLGCVPFTKAASSDLRSGCVKEASELARLHNRALSNALNKMEKKLPGLKYAVFDYYNALRDRVNNPSEYGFKEGKAACCGTGPYRAESCGGGRNRTEAYELCSEPSEYVWFDGGHTTERANYQLAKLIWNGTPNVTGPYNAKQLFELV